MAEWPPIGKIAAHSAYDMFSLYKYLIVSLFFSNIGFWSGNLFLIAPFPDLCLLVPFYDGPESSMPHGPSFIEISLLIPEMNILEVFALYSHCDLLGNVTWTIYVSLPKDAPYVVRL